MMREEEAGELLKVQLRDHFDSGRAAVDWMDVSRGEERAILRAIQSAYTRAEQDRWQPIETAPKDGTLLLLWGRYWSDEQGWMKEPLVGQFTRTRWEAWGRIPFGIRPTHWQSLPTPPAEHHKGEG